MFVVRPIERNSGPLTGTPLLADLFVVHTTTTERNIAQIFIVKQSKKLSKFNSRFAENQNHHSNLELCKMPLTYKIHKNDPIADGGGTVSSQPTKRIQNLSFDWLSRHHVPRPGCPNVRCNALKMVSIFGTVDIYLRKFLSVWSDFLYVYF